MSDHMDAADPQTDITDLYVFQTPGDSNSSTFIMNVNPAAPSRAGEFDPNASYEFKVDTNGDLLSEVAVHVLFAGTGKGGQTAAVYWATGTEAERAGAVGEVIIRAAVVSFNDRIRVTDEGGCRFYAGLRADPFFFDLDGYLDNFRWTGRNVNAQSNVFSIALQIPNQYLGTNPRIGVWVRTMALIHGELHQVDQAGHPGTSPVFITDPEEKIRFNGSHPVNQAERYLPTVMAVFQDRYGFSEAEARGLVGDWLPDLLPFDYTCAEGYPNGRKLNDDTLDAFAAAMLRGNNIPNPLDGNHDLLDRFPYLGTPHQVGGP